MAATKVVSILGLLGKVESSYGAGATLAAATEGILLVEDAVMALSYLHSGEHDFTAGTGGNRERGAPSGGEGQFTARVEARGSNAAYSSSEVPMDLHVLMRISGHSATVDTTPSSEKYTYDPVSSGFTSAAFESYARGEKYVMDSAYSDFGFTVEAPGFAIFEFGVRGVVAPGADITDVTLPSITYDTFQPPNAESASVSIGGFTTGKVRRLSFSKNLEISPRADMNTTGHAGFTVGRRNPELEIQVEAEALATYNPYVDWDAGTAKAITFSVGATQYNKFDFTASKAILRNISLDADGPTALLNLTFGLYTSTPIANDDYSIVFN